MPTETIRIRAMTASDIGSAHAIAAGLSGAPRWDPWAYGAAVLRAQANDGIALVAETPESRIAGFLVAGVIPPEVELESVVVAVDFQRQGIARRLVTELVLSAVNRGCTRILLEVRASNAAARSLYKSIGFHQTGLRPRYYSEPVEDAVLMHLPIG